MRIEFIDITKFRGDNTKNTTLTECLQSGKGEWYKTEPNHEYNKVVFLGKYPDGFDVFAVYTEKGAISIWRGVKGSEFI